jgi:hypothetical protein
MRYVISESAAQAVASAFSLNLSPPRLLTKNLT